MGINNPSYVPPSSLLTVAETEVFNGTSPTSFTDLDLSAVIGAKPALVILKIKASLAMVSFAFRKNGDSDTQGNAACAGCTAAAAVFYAVIVATDTAGIVEWITGAAVASTTIDLVAYLN